VRGTALVIVALAADAAHAQTPLPVQPCDVHIARAPDDVRAAIEAWVRAEHRCSTTLEVRVVPTEGGYYLFARDGRGFVRERIVPDAQSAGVLVASWVADDSIAPVIVIEPSRTPAPSREPSLDELLLLPRGPGTYDTMIRARDPRRPPGIAFSLGATTAVGDEMAGARFELEVPLATRSATGAGWVLATSLTLAAASFHGSDDRMVAYVESREARVMLGLGRVWASRDWQLRARAGLLLRAMMKTDTTEWYDSSDIWYPQVIENEPAMLWGGEAALLVSRRLGDRWFAIAGPVLGKDFLADGLPDVGYGAELTLFGGVTYTR
jgi:hypothetical protein